MSRLSSSTLSSLGASSASYLESVAPVLPDPLQRAIRRLAVSLKDQALLGSPPPLFIHQLRQVLDERLGIQPTPTVALTLLVGFFAILAVFTMSWRRPFDYWRGRMSPFGSTAGGAPQVSEDDFSYLTAKDIEDSSQSYDGRYYSPHQSPQVPDDGSSPDIIILKHRGVTYPLHFPAYVIGDGILTIGGLRRQAAKETGTADPRQIKLLYKGRLLKDDNKPAKAEGLKQESEVMCVRSEVLPGESTGSESSDSEPERRSQLPQSGMDGSLDPGSGGEPAKNRGKKSKGGRKKKKHRNKENKAAGSLGVPQPSPSESRPSSAASGAGGALPPSPSMVGKSPLERAEALTHYFRMVLAPLCEEYIQSPPTEEKRRDFEHKKLSETTMQQVILKADDIEPAGNERARQARKALIVEVQGVMRRLDEAAKSHE